MERILEGMELGMHGHNRQGSLSPALDNLRVLEDHPTWSLTKRRSRDGAYGEWRQVTQKSPFKPNAYLRRHLPFAAREGRSKYKLEFGFPLYPNLPSFSTPTL
jgi:hypothetical protein